MARLYFVATLFAVLAIACLVNAEDKLKVKRLDRAGVTPKRLARSLSNGNIPVVSASLKGHPKQFGIFRRGEPTLGMNRGAVFSTGKVAEVDREAANKASSVIGGPRDLDLEDIYAPGTRSYDAAALEFNFVPRKDNVELEYVFASEEHPVSSALENKFNDGIVILVNGGLCSLVPGQSTRVTVNTVNSMSNNALYVNNTNGVDLTFNGFTDVFKCRSPVHKRQMNTMKIVVGDIGNAEHDSAIFLLFGSFKYSKPDGRFQGK